jgi:ABC-type uncharacterized transport system substrate-binding protein
VAKKKKAKKLEAPPDIGIIHSGTSAKPPHPDHIKAFKKGLALFSTINTRNPKWSNDKHSTLDSIAKDLVDDGVTVLVAAGGSRSAKAAMTATTSIPIVVTSFSD